MNEFKINDENKISSGFTTPEGYFDNFSIELNNKINFQNNEVKVVFINRKKWITSIAAILILALSTTFYFKIILDTSEDSLEIENYITNQSEINQYEIIKSLDKNDIENLSIELKINNTKIDEEYTNTNEIENYLTE